MLGLMIFIVFDVFCIAAYCWFYQPKELYYGNAPAGLWDASIPFSRGKKHYSAVNFLKHK